MELGNTSLLLKHAWKIIGTRRVTSTYEVIISRKFYITGNKELDLLKEKIATKLVLRPSRIKINKAKWNLMVFIPNISEY